MTQTKTTRELLIDAIVDLGGDEIESVSDALKLAKMDARELVEQLISIAEYYKNESDN
jgi:hypothetical protein